MPKLRWAAALSILALSLGGAAASEPCEVNGTYLTIKSHDAAADAVEVGRTMLSFLPAGNIVMVDAAQGGIKGFQPFTSAHGEWRCGADDTFEAVLIDFTMPTSTKPNAQIARVDLSGTQTGGEIKGRATISFYPLGDDPMDKSAGKDVIGYDFVGTPIALAPAP